jgi:hypothetical protein
VRYTADRVFLQPLQDFVNGPDGVFTSRRRVRSRGGTFQLSCRRVYASGRTGWLHPGTGRQAQAEEVLVAHVETVHPSRPGSQRAAGVGGGHLYAWYTPQMG